MSTSKKTKHTFNSEKFTRHTLFSIFKLLAWTGLALFAIELLCALIFILIFGREAITTTPLLNTLCQAVTYITSLVVIILVPVKLFKKKASTREDLGLFGLPTWLDLALAPAGFIAYIILAALIFSGLSVLTAKFPEAFAWLNLTQSQDVGFNYLGTRLDYLLAFLALVIVAPIAEEIIFRGYLYGKLRAKIPGKYSLLSSVLLTSLLFALIHGQWNVGINVFIMSIILCLLRETTGTIYSGILLHMLKNCVAFMLLYVFNFGF